MYDYKTSFDCPKCGSINVHFETPIVEGVIEKGGADYTILIPYTCEQGCSGNITYHHHEGFSYTGYR
jgi:transcription elongation factor Elf1